VIIEERERRENANELNTSFDNGLKEQGEVTGTAKAPKINTDNFTSKDEVRLVMNGIYHAPEGYAVATDGRLLIADKSQYDKSQKGKIVLTHKAGNQKKGDIVEGKYPDWKGVIEGQVGKNKAAVSFDGIRNFLAGAGDVLKARWQAEKDSGKTTDSFANWSGDAIVGIRMPNGEICVYSYNMLRTFADAAAKMGMKDITYGYNKPLMSKNKDGVVMLMPMRPDGIYDENWKFDGKRLYYNWDGKVKQQKVSDEAASNLSETEKAGSEALDELMSDIFGDSYIVSEEGQRILDEDRQHLARLMGTKVEKRKARIASELQGRKLNDDEQVVADVFTGNNDRALLNITNKDGEQRQVVMLQGNERAGSKHSIYRHYGTGEGYITADDILKIPSVIANGEKEEKKRGNVRLNQYRYTDENGVRYTVITEVRKSGEFFNDFYTNKKSKPSNPVDANGDTDLTAQTNEGNAFSGAKLQKVSEKDNAETEKIFETAKKHFGTTQDLREAGYILPDGTMLDFSGRHELFGADDTGIKGRRTTDHRAISGIAYEYDANGNEVETGVETNMPDFIERGAIRIDDNAGTINLSQEPTQAQREVLRRLIARNGGAVSVDFGNGWDSEHYVEYDEAKPMRVLSDIDKYFEEGIKPIGDVIDETASYQKVAPTFYSNAEHAVEGIAQSKATPEQWLKMIEKNGGLKASEDKWMGLSDWLKSQDAKTLTKQEVLDYIRSNQIIVEDVDYWDIDSDKAIEKYQREYEKYYDEGTDAGEADPEQYAMDKMIEAYGDDFALGFYGNGDELVLDTNSDYGRFFLEEEAGVKPINSTRLDYTTEGLENKREIALVVPSIESWHSGNYYDDEIHFGDAGDGRAVAWIRFGDTEIVDDNKKVIDQKNKASKAFNDYRRHLEDKYGESWKQKKSVEEKNELVLMYIK
jgi:hypothetical protein